MKKAIEEYVNKKLVFDRDVSRIEKELKVDKCADTTNHTVAAYYRCRGYNVSVSGIGWRIHK